MSDVTFQRGDHDEHQQQREDHADRIAEERTQRHVHPAPLADGIEKVYDPPHDPASDEVDRQRDEDLDENPHRLGEQVLQQLVHVEVGQLADRFGEIGLLHAVGDHQGSRLVRLGEKGEQDAVEKIHNSVP